MQKISLGIYLFHLFILYVVALGMGFAFLHLPSVLQHSVWTWPGFVAFQILFLLTCLLLLINRHCQYHARMMQGWGSSGVLQQPLRL